MAEKDQDLDQTRATVLPPKETPFPKPGPAESDPRRSSRITAPPEAIEPSITSPASDGSDPRRSSRITAPPEATLPMPGGGNPRQTSRIAVPTLGTEMPDTAAGPAPKTIRVVRPLATPGTPLPAPKPGDHPLPPGPKPLSGPQMQATKSKTSRISLEAAIGAGETAPTGPLANPAGAPKTIRLKRPSEMPTLKVPSVRQPTVGGLAGVPPGIQTQAVSSKTARVAEPEEAVTAGGNTFVPLTQKRTIRVRRPGVVSTEAKAPVEDSQDESVLTPLSPAESMGTDADSCNPLFIVAAAATIIVTGVLAFMFYQQVYGPAAFY